MAEEVTMDLMYEILKKVHTGNEHLANDVRDIKFRVTKIEETLLHHTKQFDTMNERIARIEVRLDLVEA